MTTMNIKYLTNNTIMFGNMKGTLMNNDQRYMTFVNKICNIDTSKYDKIYKLDDNWAGQLLLVKGSKFRWIQCGSGRPLITETEKNGTLVTVT